MKKISKVVILALAFLLFSSTVLFANGAKESGSVLAKIKQSGKLVVGTEAQYAPYEFKDANANIVGCDMFLAKEIADNLGVKLEIVDMAFDGLIPAIQSGQIDISIAAFTNTPERAEIVDFSDIYEESIQYLVVAAGNEDVYTSVDSLAGKKVGAQRGTLQSQLIKKVFTKSELFELAKYPELAIEVKNGNIAGLVVDAAVGDAIVESSDGKLAVSNYKFDSKEANYGKSIVIKKGNEDLVAEINKVVQKVLSDGSYQKAWDEAVALQKELGL